MNKKEFDAIIKKNLIADGLDEFGYEINGKIYENYYSKAVFERFKKENNLPDYAGNEVEERSGKPPKMASVASSSRFCYLALRNGAEALGGSGAVEFEHECRIKGIKGTAPQLDAYVADGNMFIEAKCHEIFDSHRAVFAMQYWELLFGENNDFGFPPLQSPASDRFEIQPEVFGIHKRNPMFDIKQLICHLLGIKSNKKKDESAKLVYLFFKPEVEDCNVREEINEVFKMLSREIDAIFNSMPVRSFCMRNNITLSAVEECAWEMCDLSDANIEVLATI